jgi:ABC-type antimicrobial peptide transport system permease subunit
MLLGAAYAVAQRTAELGLRIALGADPAKIGRMVLRDGLLLSMAAGRISSSLLNGIRPGDPLAFVLTVAVLLVIGMVSAFVPARRAACIEPVEALRHE